MSEASIQTGSGQVVAPVNGSTDSEGMPPVTGSNETKFGVTAPDAVSCTLTPKEVGTWTFLISMSLGSAVQLLPSLVQVQVQPLLLLLWQVWMT